MDSKILAGASMLAIFAIVATASADQVPVASISRIDRNIWRLCVFDDA
jgi:hypothetical protein